MAKKEIVSISLQNIIADSEQPRKNFDATRLSELITSIKKHGIMNPIIVEDMQNGRYLLVDGERRYRAALQLKMPTVPVIIQPLSNTIDRTVKQFHLQMQHQDWSATEKASAVGFLAKELGLNITEIGKLLSLPRATISQYNSFYSLMERKSFEKSEIPLHFAQKIETVTNAAQRSYESAYEKSFSRELQSELQIQLIQVIKNGGIKKPSDFARVKDMFRADPDTIEKFIKGDGEYTSLYFTSNAKSMTSVRNVVQIAKLLQYHIDTLKTAKDIELLLLYPNATAILRNIKKRIDHLVDKVLK